MPCLINVHEKEHDDTGITLLQLTPVTYQKHITCVQATRAKKTTIPSKCKYAQANMSTSCPHSQAVLPSTDVHIATQ